MEDGELRTAIGEKKVTKRCHQRQLNTGNFRVKREGEDKFISLALSWSSKFSINVSAQRLLHQFCFIYSSTHRPNMIE